MKSKVITETITETTKRKIYVISDRMAHFFTIIAVLGVFIGLLMWLFLNFSWLFWITVGTITVWSMTLQKKIVSETRFKNYLQDKEKEN